MQQDAVLLRPIEQTSWKFWVFIGILLAIWLWGMFAWLTQLRHGLEVTGLNVPVYWGLYITNFVFFIAISHAEGPRPITRAAEVITVLVLFFGVGCVLLDLGRPDRALNVIKHPNFMSPLLWDVTSISIYLTAST